MNKELEDCTKISHYRIVSKIGKGGMGEVYLAEDTKLDRQVALKILPAEFAEDKDRMNRFVREAKSASALNHPNIITIHEIGEANETHYIATEFIDGKTLGDFAGSESLKLKATLDIAIQVVSALDEAHAAGIVHRDVKPDNIMVRENGLVKILDFGIAKLTETQTADGEAATVIQSQTQAGMIIGTPNYMSPEQARGIGVDQQTDIFSFGVVFYEMLSGSSPFAGDTVGDVIAAVLTKEPRVLSNIPTELTEILNKTLEKDKKNRYQTAKDLLNDLKEVKQELQFREKLEQTSSPDREGQQTQILKATTTAEDNPKSKIQNLKSVIVLPFTNISTDEDNEYFSDGLTEEIISDLSKIRSLRVISRNSAMKLKGTEKDLKTIAEELNVQYVLDGSVRKAGQDLRISVQLIDGTTDANLWAEKYSGSLDDIFEIQESVSRSIAEALQITLTTGEIKQIEERPIADAQAYDIYLRSRAKFMQGDAAALDRSIELLKQGLDLIGDNELLFAALGYTYYFYFRWISKIDENYLFLANECMEKTFAINPNSSHGFSLKGHLSYSEGDIAESIRSLKKAVELQPSNTEALLWLSVNSAYVGKIEDSLKYADELYQLDPVSSTNTFITGVGYAYKGDFGESLITAYRALEMNPTSPLELWSVVILEAWDGKFDKAIAHADRLAEIAPGWIYTEQGLFLKHALLGEKELALQHYTPDFDKEAKYDCHFALHIAHCFALIDEAEKALDFLETSVRAGMVNHRFLSELDPLLEKIRSEPRFQSLMTEAKQLFIEINNSTPGSDFRDEPENLEEAGTQMLPTPTTAEKRAASTTGSEEGFRIAVLPFKYRGANADLESLAEGLSEEMVTGLSRFPYLRVISRSAVLSDESASGDGRTTGEEFGIRYILEGSLRQVGTTGRIAVQLVDTATGEHLWAETYDRKLESERIFEIQDELVSRVVSTIADWHGVLVHSMAGSLRSKDKQNITPDEAVLYVFGYIERLSPEEHLAARDLLERITEEFPDRGNCWAMLAILYCNEYMYGFNLRPDPLGRALAAAQRAGELEPANYLASQSLAFAYFFRREFSAFERLAKRTITLNRMCGGTIAIFGVFFACSGEWERGCELSREAIDLNPNFPGWYRLPFMFNAYRQKDYQEALSEAEKINIPNYFWTLVMRTAALGQLGESEKAKEALNDLLVSRPDIAGKTPDEFGHWLDAEFVEDLMEGLRKAGFEIKTPSNQEEQKTQIQKADTTAEELSQSIAILPFTNMSSDEDNEYFCDGLAEELLNALSKIEDLKVAARTSAFSFKGKNANVSEIGDKLSVKNVLEGSVRKSGDKLRISVQLVNASDGYQIWSERYDREMKDIFDVQDEIALAVVDALKVELFGDEKAAVLKRGTNNTEAYQLYLKGRFYFDKFTVEGFEKSVEYYKQALALEPNYAQAFAALSKSYNFAAYVGFGETAKCISEAKAAVDKALALDESLAEAHHSLALIKFNYERDWKGAEKAFRRAIELNYAENHEHYSMFLAVLERSDEAIAEAKLTIELTPLAFVPIYIAGWGFWFAGRPDLAKEYGEKLLEMEPNFFGGHTLLGMSLWSDGAYRKSIDKLETAVKLGAGNDIKMLLGLMFGVEGEQEKANHLLTEFQRLDEQEIFTASQQAFIYAGLGEMDRAFDLLEQASERQEGNLVFLKQFSSLYPKFHNDPRMTDLLHRLGLPTDKAIKTDESIEAKTLIISTGEQTSESSAKDSGINNLKTKSASEPPINPKSKTKNPKPKWWLFGLLGLLVLVGGFFGYKYLTPTDNQINSIAVLPFENNSGNADSDYLSDGLAESLIYRLSQLPNLKVSPTSSVFRYKGKATDPKIIAQELGVDSVLTGRIVQRGDSLSISVNLVDTRDGKSLWGEKYERKMSELLATQTEITNTITNKLQLKLSGENEQKLAKKYTVNDEAYQLYLKGRFHFAKRTKDDILKGIEYFQQAIQLDPNFALAYVGIANSYNSIVKNGDLTPKEVTPQAKAAANKALEIDSTLADAHAAFADVLAIEWNWAEAEKEFKKAIELDPNVAYTHVAYGTSYLLPMGRKDEAVAELKRAVELESLSLINNAVLVSCYLYAGQNDKALEQGKKTYDLDPNFRFGQQWLGQAYIANGNYTEAINISEKALNTFPFAQENIAVAGQAYAKSGRRREAEKYVEKLDEMAKTKSVRFYLSAAIYAALGDKDKAFAELEKAYQERDWFLPRLKVDPIMDSLRDDPRYKDLLKRMNLPE